MSERKVELSRETKETKISLVLDLTQTTLPKIETGLGMLNHLLTSLAQHGRFFLELRCQGDLEVDDHHTTEDCALTLGAAFDKVLGDRRGITRFGHAYAPLDEALARAVVDFSGRPYSVVGLGMTREFLGTLSCENIAHFFSSFAVGARASLHVDVLRGQNNHHRAEAAFKALALALRQAIKQDGGENVPSTKGVLI